MLRKAKAGHVTGGACFGYRTVEILDASGTRSHVERRIDNAEAAIVRRIFQLSVEGHGMKAIAKILNADGAASPRATGTVQVVGADLRARGPIPRHLSRGDHLESDPQAKPVGDPETGRAADE